MTTNTAAEESVVFPARVLWPEPAVTLPEGATSRPAVLRSEDPTSDFYPTEASRALGAIGPAAREALSDLLHAFWTAGARVRHAASDAVRRIDPKTLDRLAEPPEEENCP